MNILFVNYGDFTTNSLNHIAGFANWLVSHGHDCAVAVPSNRESLEAIYQPRFNAKTFAEIIAADGRIFSDGQPATVIHAWTPRENVRKFILAHQRLQPTTRVAVHLEDNEEYLCAAFAGQPIEELRQMADDELQALLPETLSHPRRYRNLLHVADGVTVLVDRLREFVPSGAAHSLLPGVDFSLYKPSTASVEFRRGLGLDPADKVIVYTGSTTFANQAEIRELLLAIHQLDRPERPVRLVRTGFHPSEFFAACGFDWNRFTIDVGFVAKTRLPALLALADILVQPGQPGAFNDYRLPSKLPEFLAVGRPVILPACNIGLQVQDGKDALVLRDGDAGEISRLCEQVFADGELAKTLGTRAAKFARRHFDLDRIGPALVEFYQSILAKDARANWGLLKSGPLTESSLLPLLARTSIANAVPTENAQSATLFELIADLSQAVAQTEGLVARGMAARLQQKHEAHIAELANRCQLTSQHASNLEAQLTDLTNKWQLTSQHASNLEAQLTDLTNKWRLTSQHASNLEAQLTDLTNKWQLTNQHASNLEAQLTDLTNKWQLTSQHASNLEAQLTDLTNKWQLTSQHASNLEAQATELKTQLQLAKENAATLAALQAKTRATLDDLRAFSDRQIREYEQSIRDHRRRIDELDQLASAHQQLAHNFQAELVRRDLEARQEAGRLNDKIIRMQSSFSWRATAPLRALRRRLLDPHRRLATTPAVAPPASEGALVHAIDQPSFWYVPAGTLTISGWCLLPDGTPPATVRARLGAKEILGITGISRPDVAANQSNPAAELSGFSLDLQCEPGRHSVHLEAAGKEGGWYTMRHADLRVFAPNRSDSPAASYEEWLRIHEQIDIEAPAAGPLISVLMPVYNPPERWLRRAIESVRNQAYKHWELCIADDASIAPHVRRVLEDAMSSDSRIKVVFRSNNGHISATSNSALELVCGEYVALLDHDDELAPHALARVAQEIALHPDGVYFFSDEDKIDESGRRFDPYFKPDFLPDLLTGQNCLSHLSVIRTDAVREAGGFRCGFEGSQDWDLALRITDRCGPERVHHIPEVLYHWRTVQGSTARSVSEKSYSITASQRALNDHFMRKKIAVELREIKGGHWRVVFPLPTPAPLVSLVIPTRNRVDLLRTCVNSILRLTDYPAFEILIVDNQSDDPTTLAWLGEIATADARVRVLNYDQPFNYSAINNFAVRQARGEIVGLLNNDLECISSDWLREMASHAVRAEIGCVGAMLYYPNNTIQHAGIVLGLGGVANHAFCRLPRGTDGYMNRARLVQNYSAVTAACLLIRREVYLQVGGLNEQDLAVAFNDVDFCLRVRAAGYRNLWTPFAEFYHHESASRGLDESPEKRARFLSEVEYMQRTWGPLLAQDPAYNRNLSVDIDGFKLARPPRRTANQLEAASTS